MSKKKNVENEPKLKAVKSEKVIEFKFDDRKGVIEFLKDQIKFIDENERSAGKVMMIVGYDDNEFTDDYTYSSYSFSLRDFIYSSEMIKFNLLAENYNE